MISVGCVARPSDRISRSTAVPHHAIASWYAPSRLARAEQAHRESASMSGRPAAARASASHGARARSVSGGAGLPTAGHTELTALPIDSPGREFPSSGLNQGAAAQGLAGSAATTVPSNSIAADIRPSSAISAMIAAAFPAETRLPSPLNNSLAASEDPAASAMSPRAAYADWRAGSWDSAWPRWKAAWERRPTARFWWQCRTSTAARDRPEPPPAPLPAFGVIPLQSTQWIKEPTSAEHTDTQRHVR